MARGKKGRKFKDSASAEQVLDSADVTTVKTPATSSRRFQWWDYVAIGVFFVIFCIIQTNVGIMMTKSDFEVDILKVPVEQTALEFMFGTIWKGFIVVLLLVWLYDYFYHDVEEDT